MGGHFVCCHFLALLWSARRNPWATRTAPEAEGTHSQEGARWFPEGAGGSNRRGPTQGGATDGAPQGAGRVGRKWGSVLGRNQ